MSRKTEMGISVGQDSTVSSLEPVAKHCDLLACGKGGRRVRVLDYNTNYRVLADRRRFKYTQLPIAWIGTERVTTSNLTRNLIIPLKS
jgi:hypothetical protein